MKFVFKKPSTSSATNQVTEAPKVSSTPERRSLTLQFTKRSANAPVHQNDLEESNEDEVKTTLHHVVQQELSKTSVVEKPIVDIDADDDDDDDEYEERLKRREQERRERPPTRAQLMAKKLLPLMRKQADSMLSGYSFLTKFSGPLYDELMNMHGGIADRTQSFCEAAILLGELFIHGKSIEYPAERYIACFTWKMHKPLRALDGFRTRLVGKARKEMKEKKKRNAERARKSMSS